MQTFTLDELIAYGTSGPVDVYLQHRDGTITKLPNCTVTRRLVEAPPIVTHSFSVSWDMEFRPAD